MKSIKKLSALALVTVAAALALPAHSAAIRNASEFTDFTLTRNDDGSTGLVSIGFNIDFFGLSRTSLYVNNNGNVTFDSPLSTFTPFALSTTNRQILAPFFADVDTRNAASAEVQYGTGTVDGRDAFGVNWIGVGYYPSAADKLNSFQLIIIDRSDIRDGDFDFEFNYDSITWETGGASGGTSGLGGSSARVGWSNGDEATFELAGSAINGALLNAGPASLVRGSLNSDVAGRYVFNVRNGTVVGTVPNPGTLALAGLALAAVGLLARRRKA